MFDFLQSFRSLHDPVVWFPHFGDTLVSVTSLRRVLVLIVCLLELMLFVQVNNISFIRGYFLG